MFQKIYSGFVFLLDPLAHCAVFFSLYEALMHNFFNMAAFDATAFALLYLFILLLTATRRGCRYLSVFLLLHLLAAVGVIYLVYNETIPIIGGIVCIVYVLFSFLLRILKDWEKLEYPHFFYMALVAAAYFYGIYQNASWLENSSLILGSILAFSYLIHIHFEEMESYLQNNQNRSHLPVRQIRFVNRSMFAIYLILVLIAALIFSRLPLGPVLAAVGNGLLWLIRSLVKLFSHSEEEEPPTAAYQELPKADMGFIDRTQEGSWILNLLAQIAGVLVFIGLIVLAVFLIIKAVISLYQTFYMKKGEGTDIKEFINPFEKKEKVSPSRKRKRRFGIFASPEDKIRRVYKKIILRRAGGARQLSGSDTPSDQIAKAGFEQNDASMVHEIYAKARYGKEPCTPEDLEKLRKL